MIETDWLANTRPFDMINFLEKSGTNKRRLRLFACACFRSAWNLLQREAARRIVDLAEDCADGEASEAELQAASVSNDFDDMPAQSRGMVEAKVQLTARALYAIHAARNLASPNFSATRIVLETSRKQVNDYLPTPQFNETTGRGTGYDEVEIAEKTKLLRDIFGNPFHPAPFMPEWRTSMAIKLATQMYKSRDFSAMPALADVLQEAGGDNEEVLGHCRGDGPHVRGCWVVDLILNKL